jgi:hypothetical protein
MSVTGNPMRDAILRNALTSLDDHSLATVQAVLPGDFDLDQGELDAMLATMTASKDAAAEPVEAESVEAPEPPTLSLSEANAALADWQHKTQLARMALSERDREQRAARAKLVEAINFFLRGNVTMTREQLQREHIASEQARKAAGAERHRPLTTHGPSVFDIGRAGHGHSVNRRYSPTRRGLVPGQRAYSIEDSIRRSGSATVDLRGTAPVPAIKSE